MQTNIEVLVEKGLSYFLSRPRRFGKGLFLSTSGFDAKQITKGELYAPETVLTDYRFDNPNHIHLFYQSGYLTIKGYALPYAADKRTLLKIGVNFDSKERSIAGWQVSK